MRSGFRPLAAALIAASMTCSVTGAGPCPADATGDFQVDVQDLIVVITQWGTPGPEGDVNADGAVDILDLVDVLLAWGSCDPICGDTGELEDEACGTDVNGGCNSTPPIYAAAACGESWCGTAWADGGIRDTDWYLLDVPEDGVLSATLTADFPASVVLVAVLDLECAVVPGPVGYVDGGGTTTISTSVLAGEYAVFVAPGTPGGGVFDGLPCDDGPHEYRVDIGCGP